MKHPSISIIIPVYNAETYLESCLAGIRAQTFSDYEAWLIDDGSSDASGEICDRYQAEDPRFRVIHQRNGGVSAARNAGLRAAQGEWVGFIDADDTVEADYLEGLFRATEGMNKDTLILQGFKTLFGTKKTEILNFPDQLLQASEIHRIFQERSINWCGHPFAKLYNISIIRQHYIVFNQHLHYAEDAMFMLTYLCHATSIRTVSGGKYNHIMRKSDSLSKHINSFESEYLCYQTYNSLILTLKERFDMPEKSLLKTYNAIGEFLVRRSLGSLYQPQTRKRRQDRIALLKSLSPEQISFLRRYYKQCSWFHKVTVFLLAKHYYYLCDLFNISISGRFALRKMIKKI